MARRNLVALLLSIALFAIATNIRSGWVYFLSSIILSSVIIGFVSARVNARRITLVRRCHPTVFENEPFEVNITVKNKGRFCAKMITVEDFQFCRDMSSGDFIDLLRNRFSGKKNDRESLRKLLRFKKFSRKAIPEAAASKVTLEAIRGGEAVEVSYKLKPPLRGYYPFAAMNVSSASIIGNARYDKIIRLDSPVTVFPAVYKIERFPFEPVDLVSSAEYFEWTRKGIGQDYFGIREYSRGDSLRHIHWRSSARHNRLIVKEYQQEFRPSAGLVIFLNAPEFGTRYRNTLEDGLRASSSIVNFYSEMGCVPGIIFARTGTPEVLVPHSVIDCYRALAAFEPYNENGSASGRRKHEILRDAVDLGRSALFPGSSISIVTNIHSDEFELLLRTLPFAENLTFVLVMEESYSKKMSQQEESEIFERLKMLAASCYVNLYVIRREKGVGDCLNEPLHIIAA